VRWTRKRIVIVASAVAVSTFLALVLVPVPHNFTIDNAVIADLAPCSGLETLQGTTVSFHWTAPSPITFFVVSCSENQEVYEGNGTQGSGSLLSVGGVYEFGAGCPEGPCPRTDVSGSLTGPLLNL
jgi:hypothetical protein